MWMLSSMFPKIKNRVALIEEADKIENNGDQHNPHGRISFVEFQVKEGVIDQTTGDEEERMTWKAAWYDFCQNTSIHALRQITEPQHWNLRRWEWSRSGLFSIFLCLSKVSASERICYVYGQCILVISNENLYWDVMACFEICIMSHKNANSFASLFLLLLLLWLLAGTYKTQELPCYCGPGPHMFKVYSR